MAEKGTHDYPAHRGVLDLGELQSSLSEGFPSGPTTSESQPLFGLVRLRRHGGAPNPYRRGLSANSSRSAYGDWTKGERNRDPTLKHSVLDPVLDTVALLDSYTPVPCTTLPEHKRGVNLRTNFGKNYSSEVKRLSL